MIVGRCIARLNGQPDAEDVAQNVRLRLLAEFKRGKRYGAIPYRVVVHQVIGWTLADYFDEKPTDVPLPDDWEPSVGDSIQFVHEKNDLRTLFATLPDRTRRVLELRYILGLDIEVIAENLKMKRNAVDQALNRGHKKLQEAVASG